VALDALHGISWTFNYFYFVHQKSKIQFIAY